MTRKHFITVGTFDGVHLGHRKLFNRLEQLAVMHQMKPLVLYFPYPPKTLLSPRPEMSVLSTPAEKKLLLKNCLDVPAQELNFQAYREYTPEMFFNRVYGVQFFLWMQKKTDSVPKSYLFIFIFFNEKKWKPVLLLPFCPDYRKAQNFCNILHPISTV